MCQSLLCLGLVSFPVLSHILLQAPLPVVPFRQFLQASALRPYSPRNPKTQISHKLMKESYKKQPPMSSWHSLWLELGWYLIGFDSLMFVLGQRKHPWQMLSRSPSLSSPRISPLTVVLRRPSAIPTSDSLSFKSQQVGLRPYRTTPR